MNIRTDLALERADFSKKGLNGVFFLEEEKENVTISRLVIETDEAAKKLKKPIGKYTTLTLPRFTKCGSLDLVAVNVFAKEIRRLLPTKTESVLVAGLGNTAITSDSLGPEVAKKIIATRHIPKEMKKELSLGKLLPVSVIAPGVLGQTGVETGEILLGLVERIKPTSVIVVDALAARSISRLGCTVQLSNTGICPGSGVGNSRKEISEKTLGIPVVSVGVPTVVDINTLLYDMGVEKSSNSDMIVTPKEVDMMIDRAAEMLAVGINSALQASLSLEDIMGLI